MSSETSDGQTASGQGRIFWIGVSALIILMFVLGWYFSRQNNIQPQAPEPRKLASCKPIPDGMAFVNGKLVPAASGLSCPSAEPVKVDESDWTRAIEAGFPALGFDWLTLSLIRADDGSETVELVGTAPEIADRRDAIDLATRAIRLADNGTHAGVTIISNKIDVERGKADWADDMSASLKGLGLDWMELAVRGPVATVSGEAPDQTAADDAYNLTEAAIERNAKARAQVKRLINGITIAGDVDGSAADALVDLSNADTEELSVTACSEAFTRTMQGRNIQFEVNSAAINPASAELLDALSGIALLCVNSNGHNVEIGGHSDTTGNAQNNLVLSQARAEAVQTYLAGLGVEAGKLKAVGYGATKLLDTDNTEGAHAKNRRTEFTVTASE